MIETFFGLDALSGANAFLAAFLIGGAFGFALERAGFGSSRKLAGIFYFRDMTVLKVMFTAVIVAMLGLHYCLAVGWLRPEQVYFMPSVYGAQIVGGLLFGVGFVMSAWCPGTAAVGLASGRIDALVFLGGAVLGSVLFNELYGLVAPLYTWGASGVRFAWRSLGISSTAFALLFACVAVGAFWLAELVERRMAGGGAYWRSPFLKAFSTALVVLAVGLFIVPGAPMAGQSAPARAASVGSADADANLMADIEAGADHVAPEDLADRLMDGDRSLLVADVRTAGEFAAFHIRGAVHVPLNALADELAAHRGRGDIVLYSNGMTHPAQARDWLARRGFGNVYILTDGLRGFVERCLKPASLRSEPAAADTAARIRAWRAFFLAGPTPATQPAR